MAIGLAFGGFLLENNQVLAELANYTIQVPSPSFHRARLKYFLSFCSFTFLAMLSTGLTPGPQV